MDENSKKIMLRISGIEKIPKENFQEVLQVDSVAAFKYKKATDSVAFLCFFETDEVGNFIVSDNEEDFAPDEMTGEDKDGHSYLEWVDVKYDERIQSATDWMVSKQNSLLRLQELGAEMEIYIQIWGHKEFLVLPSSFVSACGKSNLSISLQFN